ncbi:MAG: dTMP kinase [Actinomycetota bacterium]|nr:dTMP kinase [Actinomycetota bacterium]
MSSSRRGIFVTLEGLDFSGKSTLVRALKPLLTDLNVPTLFTREPGGPLVAEKIREILLDPKLDMDAWTEAYLYAAARADHMRREILPAIERGENVFCERYLDSSLAYQGFGRGLGVETVRELNSWAVGEVVPDRTFYLRLHAEERARRARNSGALLDRIEKVGAEFAGRVEAGFEELVRLEPERIEALDATRPPEMLAETVARAFTEFTERRRLSGRTGR